MANYFCTDSVEEQVDYLTDKVKDLNTKKLDKAAVVQATGTGIDVVMSQKAVTDEINENLQTVNESLQTVNTEVNNKLTKPTNPSAESAVTMSADGTVVTKLLSEIGVLNTIKAGTGQFSEVFNYNASNANTATGSYAHAEGLNSVASDTASHAEGEGTVALNYASHAEGKYNIIPMPSNLIHATGIGLSDSDRRDGFEVYKTGEVWCKGPLYVGGNSYKLDKTTSKEVATKEYVDSQIGGGGGGGKLYAHTIELSSSTNGRVYFIMFFTERKQFNIIQNLFSYNLHDIAVSPNVSTSEGTVYPAAFTNSGIGSSQKVRYWNGTEYIELTLNPSSFNDLNCTVTEL